MNWIKELAKPTQLGISLGLLLLIIFASLNDWGVTGVIFIVLAYFLGLATGMAGKTEENWGEYFDSDWAHFDKLTELTPEQIAKLQSLTRRPSQKADALEYLERQWTLTEGSAEKILHFFIRSGWATGGKEAETSADPEWQWNLRG